jgi:hypothetical protein
MLLFGMINWLFTWFRPGQPLDYSTLAPLVADLFLNGVGGLHIDTLTQLEGERADAA